MTHKVALIVCNGISVQVRCEDVRLSMQLESSVHGDGEVLEDLRHNSFRLSSRLIFKIISNEGITVIHYRDIR